MIELTAKEMDVVTAILEKHLPGMHVRAFGPRARGNAKPDADLDLCVMNEQPLPFDQVSELMEDFANAGLSFTVDICEWAITGGEMRKRIEREAKVLM